MNPPRGTVFLERDSYRRRRIMDAARILPVAGFVLILLPVLWSFDTGARIAAEAVYMFVLWCALIVVAAVLSRPLRAGLQREAQGGAGGGGTGLEQAPERGPEPGTKPERGSGPEAEI